MVLSPAPVAKQKNDEPGARTLAYEQAIAQREKQSEAKSDDSADPASETDDVPAFETVTTPGDPPQDVAALPDEVVEDTDPSEDMAAVPGAQPSPYDSVPPLPGEDAAGQDQWGTDGAEQWGDERDRPWADDPPPGDPYGPPGNDPYAAQDDPYGPPGGDPYAQDPYAQDDPYAQGDPYAQSDPNAEEWVEVIISGSAMRATASEDAPMLFAFPYGRNLKVVSRYEGWVEVIDPQSSATGWMQAHALAPSRADRGYGQTEAYYDDQPRRNGGWLRRNTDGFADMLNRALGGAF